MSEYQSGHTTPVSGFSKLPPIVTSEIDREFLRCLNEFIELELGKVDPNDDEQRYIVYKTAFNRVWISTGHLYFNSYTSRPAMSPALCRMWDKPLFEDTFSFIYVSVKNS